jgi:hypothetical protein
VRQVRDEDGGIRSRVEGPCGQGYAPHAVNGLRVSEARRLHDALRAYSPVPAAVTGTRACSGCFPTP